MKSRRTGRKQKKSCRGKLLLAALLVLTACGAAAFACFLKLTLEPNMEDMAKIRAEVLVSRTVTRVLADQFQQEISQEDLFSVTKDTEGTMSMVQAIRQRSICLCRGSRHSCRNHFRI